MSSSAYLISSRFRALGAVRLLPLATALCLPSESSVRFRASAHFRDFRIQNFRICVTVALYAVEDPPIGRSPEVHQNRCARCRIDYCTVDSISHSSIHSMSPTPWPIILDTRDFRACSLQGFRCLRLVELPFAQRPETSVQYQTCIRMKSDKGPIKAIGTCAVRAHNLLEVFCDGWFSNTEKCGYIQAMELTSVKFQRALSCVTSAKFSNEISSSHKERKYRISSSCIDRSYIDPQLRYKSREHEGF